MFMFSDIVGSGLPMYLPNGFTVRRALSDYIMNKELEQGYEHVMTPSVANVRCIRSPDTGIIIRNMFPAMQDGQILTMPMSCDR
jgi:threonyl-tRNA synthetase